MTKLMLCICSLHTNGRLAVQNANKNSTKPMGSLIHVISYWVLCKWNFQAVWPRQYTCVHFSFFLSGHNNFACYVMLWPAFTWRGQEWAQHVQGQLLHTCIMQMAGSHHVMELPLTVYKCRASLVKLPLLLSSQY